MENVHIALDFDRTLSYFDGDINKMPTLIPEMVIKLKKWLELGYKVSIFTARVSPEGKDGKLRETDFTKQQRKLIQKSLSQNEIPDLEITCIKSGKFTHFVDDKAVPVEPNKGKWSTHIKI